MRFIFIGITLYTIYLIRLKRPHKLVSFFHNLELLKWGRHLPALGIVFNCYGVSFSTAQEVYSLRNFLGFQHLAVGSGYLAPTVHDRQVLECREHHCTRGIILGILQDLLCPALVIALFIKGSTIGSISCSFLSQQELSSLFFTQTSCGTLLRVTTTKESSKCLSDIKH